MLLHLDTKLVFSHSGRSSLSTRGFECNDFLLESREVGVKCPVASPFARVIGFQISMEERRAHTEFGYRDGGV